MRLYEVGNDPIPGLGRTFNHNITDEVKDLDDSVFAALLYVNAVFTNNDPANPATAVAGATGSDLFSRMELFTGPDSMQSYESRGPNLASYILCGFPLLQNADLPGPIAAGGGQQTIESYWWFPLGVRDSLRALDFCVTPSSLTKLYWRLSVGALASLYEGASPIDFQASVESNLVAVPSGSGVRLGAIPIIKESAYNVVAGHKGYDLGSGRLLGSVLEAGNKTFGRISLKAGSQAWGDQDEIERFQLVARQLRRRETDTPVTATTVASAFAYENLNYWFLPCAEWERKFGKIPMADWNLEMNLSALGGDSDISIMSGFGQFPADNAPRTFDMVNTFAKRKGLKAREDLVLVPQADGMAAVPVDTTGTTPSSPIPVKVVDRAEAVRIERQMAQRPQIVTARGG